jgi:UDP-N-acetylglucosamine acyltransferase
LIDPRACVDSGATLADDVCVGPYSVVGPDVEIGPGTWVGPHVVINGHTRIGADNRIFQFASVGEIPQDMKYNGEVSELIIGDRNTIREFCTINRGTSQDRGVTTVGDDNWIMAYVHIAHDCEVGNHIILANGTTLGGHVRIEDYAVLGGFTLVHQFCNVGAYSFCGGGTVLTRDLPPYVMASGGRAKPYGLNKEGLKRHQFDPGTVRALHKAYMLLIKSRKVDDTARSELLELSTSHPEVARFVEFIDDSKRGILK